MREEHPIQKAPPGPRTRGDGLVLAVPPSLGRGASHTDFARLMYGGSVVLRGRRNWAGAVLAQPVGPVSSDLVAYLVDVAVGEGPRAKDMGRQV